MGYRVASELGKKGVAAIGSQLAQKLATNIPLVGGMLSEGLNIVTEELGEELGNVVSNTMHVQLVAKMNTDIVESVTLFFNLIEIESCIFQWPHDIRERSIENFRRIKTLLGFPNNTFYSDQEIFSFIENLTYISSGNKKAYLDMDSKLVEVLGSKINTELSSDVLEKYVSKEKFPKTPVKQLRSIHNMSGIRRLVVSEFSRIIEKYCKDNDIDENSLDSCDEKCAETLHKIDSNVSNLIVQNKKMLEDVISGSKDILKIENFSFD